MIARFVLWLHSGEAQLAFAALVAVAGPVAGLMGREIARSKYSTAEVSAPGATRPVSGVETWAVELPSGGARMCPRPVEAGAETTGDLSCGGSFALSAVPTDGPTPR